MWLREDFITQPVLLKSILSDFEYKEGSVTFWLRVNINYPTDL